MTGESPPQDSYYFPFSPPKAVCPALPLLSLEYVKAGLGPPHPPH